LLELIVTIRPLGEGAGPDKVSTRLPTEPAATGRVDGASELDPLTAPLTLTAAVTLAKPEALAVMTAEPAATPATEMVTLAEPAGMVAIDCTEATPELLELRATVNPPAGATPPVRLRVRIPEEPALRGRLEE
jgi:hypothetical protein